MPTPNYVAQAPTMEMIDETKRRFAALEQGREADRVRINTLERAVEELQAQVKGLMPKTVDEAFVKKAKG